MLPIARQREMCRINRLDSPHGVAFDTRNLNKPAYGIASHAQVVLHGNFSCVFDLRVRTAEHSGQPCGGHRGRHSNLTLTAHFRSRNRCVFLVQRANGRGGEQVGTTTGITGTWAGIKIETHYRRDDASSAVGGCCHDSAASRIFLIHGNGIGVHRIECGQRTTRRRSSRKTLEHGSCATPYAKRAGQQSVSLKPTRDAVKHHIAQLVESISHILRWAQCKFILESEFSQTTGSVVTKAQQFG